MHPAWCMAEGVGFEPTSPFGETVFKTAAIDHSAIPPRIRLRRITIFTINFWLLTLLIESWAMRFSPFDLFYAAQVGPQSLRDDHGSVLLLEILQNGYQRSADGQA